MLTDVQLIVWITSHIDASTLIEQALPEESLLPDNTMRNDIHIEQVSDSRYLVMKIRMKVSQCREQVMIKGHYQKQNPNPEIVEALVQGWHERQLIQQGLGMEAISKKCKQTKNVIRSRLLMAYLSPNIMKRLLSGKHPDTLRVTDVYKIARASDAWTKQEALFSTYPS